MDENDVWLLPSAFFDELIEQLTAPPIRRGELFEEQLTIKYESMIAALPILDPRAIVKITGV